MVRFEIRLFLILLAVLAGTLSSSAHSTGEHYIFVDVKQDGLRGRFEIHFNNLREDLMLEPPKGDAAKAWVAENKGAVQTYIGQHFSFKIEGEKLPIQFGDTSILELPQGHFAQYHFRCDRDPLPDRITIETTMFFRANPRHRGLFLIDHNEKTGTSYGEEHTALVLGPDTASQEVDLLNVPSILKPSAFVWQGILHIWIGIDHILFLLALILPSVLKREDKKWVPVGTFRQAFWQIVKIVTLFTIAHSITLSLAALDFIVIPSKVVESIIALSIVVVALNNIFPKFNEKSWLLIVFFGLFHGLGFASVMGHLPFRMVDLLKVVLAFNVGVEIGQVAIVLAIFPLLFLIRKTGLYLKLMLIGGSIAVGLIAFYWFFERALGPG